MSSTGGMDSLATLQAKLLPSGHKIVTISFFSNEIL